MTQNMNLKEKENKKENDLKEISLNLNKNEKDFKK